LLYEDNLMELRVYNTKDCFDTIWHLLILLWNHEE
jgi:hypothetical protein